MSSMIAVPVGYQPVMDVALPGTGWSSSSRSMIEQNTNRLISHEILYLLLSECYSGLRTDV